MCKSKVLSCIFLVMLMMLSSCASKDENQSNSELDTTQENTTEQQNKEIVTVGILQLLSHPALDLIHKGLVDELQKEGYTEGENLKIEFLNAEGDQSLLPTFSEQLAENNDFLVAITTPSALALSNTTKEKPIIMAGISYPVDTGLIESEEKPNGNITGVSDRTPIKQQFELIQKIIPNIKNVGILYSLGEETSYKQLKEAKDIAKELGINIQEAAISNTTELQTVAANLSENVQAIYVPLDNMIASAMPTLIKETDKQKIPVFPSSDTMVKDGGVLAIGIDQYKIGVDSANILVKVIKGEKPADIPIHLSAEGDIYINSKKAKELNIELPKDILEKSKDVTQS